MNRLFLVYFCVILSVNQVIPLKGVSGEEIRLPRYSWSHSGPFGTIDKAAAQRGLQVYEQVCKTCHSLKHVAFRHLTGIGFTADQVKLFAQGRTITDRYNSDGEEFERPGRASDYFPSPYANDVLARLANNGALPVDLSHIVSARVGGEDYITALLTGYTEAPQGFEVPDGQSYNTYYPGHLIAMPQMLYEGTVEYTDGTPATLQQQAQDVATFLLFVSDPHHDSRKRIGIQVLLFFGIFTGLMVATKRRLWGTLKNKD